MAGAVSVTVDRERSIERGRRLRSKVLPENLFNPFRHCRSRKRQLVTPRVQPTPSDVPAADVLVENHHVTSAAAAAIAVQGIKKGVSDALDRWALQTARRESMVLWRHECSRYASSSRIGYHPNHPSASRPSSRPSSATTIIRPFSAGRVPQHKKQHQQRASSARPPRLRPQEMGTEVDEAGVDSARSADKEENRAILTRPRSAIPRLGVGAGQDTDNADGREADSRPKRGVSASAAMADGNDIREKNDSLRGGTHSNGARRSRSARSHSPALTNPGDLPFEGEEDIFDEIYEDLDEDDDELDNRISIMESRFSTVGRERPDSAVGDGAVGIQLRRRSGSQRTAANATPHSAVAERPPRAPPQERQSSAGPRPSPLRQLISSVDAQGKTEGELRKYTTGEVRRGYPPPSSTSVYGAQAPLVIRSRPTSAPVDGGTSTHQYRQGGDGGAVHDPMAPLHARRLRLQMSSAGAEESRSQAGHARRACKKVTTALPTWNREEDGGSRPVSSVTEGGSRTVCSDAEASNAGVNFRQNHKSEDSTPSTTPSNSRPSSAAFRRWIKARPSALSAVSAVSSARTLGMDDPELVHLQLEMESRRGGMSDTTLARMEDHYTAVVLKNSNTPRQHRRRSADRTKQSRPTSPRKKGGRGKSPRKNNASSKGSQKGASKGGSKSPRKGRKRKGNRGGKTTGGRKGKSGGGRREFTSATNKIYTSASAFMEEHFPSEDAQGVSLLGMEQEAECRQAAEILSRAGVSVSSASLRRALVIPTDRPLETCLAGLPLPMEGLRETLFPTPPTPLMRHHAPTLLPSGA
ncbi:unnamed protein product, partial [Scytosiphon promiscuus]